MQRTLKEYFKKRHEWSNKYIKIENRETLKLVYDLFIKNVKGELNQKSIDDGLLYYYYGFYNYINDNNVEMIVCYTKAYALGITKAMINLGDYFFEKKDYSNMLECYDKVDRCGKLTHKDMDNLGFYYDNMNDVKNAQKCYLRAIENGSIKAMISLAHSYELDGDIENMFKYLNMAIDLYDEDAMDHLAYYYISINDYVNYEKYVRMAAYYGKKIPAHILEASILKLNQSKDTNEKIQIQVDQVD